MEPYAEITRSYADFAAYAGESPCFEAWALGVVGDPEVQQWLSTLPRIKQQPNLVFAAARWHGVPAPGPYEGLRAALLADDGTIRQTIMTRATQTNEVGRLATLVPAFATLVGEEPVSLVEIGASAGLCLYPDRWGYAWSTDAGVVSVGPEPRLECAVSGPAPLPDAPIRVARRAGVDLNPLPVTDPDAMAWLTTLVWPEQDQRRRVLAHGVEVARADLPQVSRGDLLERLPTLVAEAASAGPVVVFHSAVIAYLEDDERGVFRELIGDLVTDGACHWVSNEAPNVLPDLAAAAGVRAPSGRFVLGIDGRPVAWTHGHGRSLDWFDLA